MRVILTSLPGQVQAVALTPGLILLRPQRRNDPGLLAHEKMHCEQMQRDGLLRFWWRYLTDRNQRLRYEVQAYKVSLAYRPDHLDEFAQVLARNYRLGITVDAARALLLEP